MEGHILEKLLKIQIELKAKYYKEVLGIISKEFDSVYREYLHSSQWAEKRASILNRDSYTCQYCNTAPAEQVHHLSYRNLGNESDFELIAVCIPCHEIIHQTTIDELLNRRIDNVLNINTGNAVNTTRLVTTAESSALKTYIPPDKS